MNLALTKSGTLIMERNKFDITNGAIGYIISENEYNRDGNIDNIHEETYSKIGDHLFVKSEIRDYEYEYCEDNHDNMKRLTSRSDLLMSNASSGGKIKVISKSDNIKKNMSNEVITEYRYNKKGNISSKTVRQTIGVSEESDHNKKGVIISRTVYTYGKNGEISEKVYNKDNKLTYSRKSNSTGICGYEKRYSEDGIPIYQYSIKEEVDSNSGAKIVTRTNKTFDVNTSMFNEQKTVAYYYEGSTVSYNYIHNALQSITTNSYSSETRIGSEIVKNYSLIDEKLISTDVHLTKFDEIGRAVEMSHNNIVEWKKIYDETDGIVTTISYDNAGNETGITKEKIISLENNTKVAITKTDDTKSISYRADSKVYMYQIKNGIGTLDYYEDKDLKISYLENNNFREIKIKANKEKEYIIRVTHDQAGYDIQEYLIKGLGIDSEIHDYLKQL